MNNTEIHTMSWDCRMDLVPIISCKLELWLSDYDIWPKPKVWAGSPYECRTSAECYMLGWNNVFYWWAH